MIKSSRLSYYTLCHNIRDIGNTMAITGDFNIRNSNWDPNFHHYSIYIENLLTIADSLGLELSLPSNPGPTRYTNNLHDTNSILDLVFLQPNNLGFG